jgi:N-methylhydantoinase A
MANAVRSKTIQKGYDPRDFTLVAFGGAGPTHAAEVASSIGISEVIVPLYPGLTSAIGLLTTDVKYDEIQNVFMLNSSVDYDRLNRSLVELETKIRMQLIEDGLDEKDITIERGADCRYEGQGYELRASIPEGEIIPENIDAIWNNFHQLHEEQYHHAFTDNPIELVNVRVTGMGRMPKISSTTIEGGGKDGSEAYLRTTRTIFRVNGDLKEFETSCYERHRLKAGSLISAPAILLQRDTTTVIPPGWTARVEENGNIILNLKS